MSDENNPCKGDLQERPLAPNATSNFAGFELLVASRSCINASWDTGSSSILLCQGASCACSWVSSYQSSYQWACMALCCDCPSILPRCFRDKYLMMDGAETHSSQTEPPAFCHLSTCASSVV